MLENETTTVVGVGGAGLCPPLIIEATRLKESLKNAQCLRRSEEEIPAPISPGRSAQKDQEASRPHPPPLIILPTAGIPSSSSHSRLNLCRNMAAGAILAMWRRRRRTWPTVAAVMAMCLSGRLPDSTPSLFCTRSLLPPSIHLHLPPFLPFACWQSCSQPQIQFI